MHTNDAISYADDLSEGQGVKVLYKLLIRWKGSLYKLVWSDLIVYLVAYYIISFTYRFGLNENQKIVFEHVVRYFDQKRGSIPISFLLGFFVSGVIARWWQMYLQIPWLNRLAFLLDGLVIGKGSERSRPIRICVMRYLNLAWILLMRKVSEQMANRFRSAKNASGSKEVSLRDMFYNFNQDKKIRSTFRKIITDSEIIAFEKIAAQHKSKDKNYVPEYWIPMQWASRLLQKAFLHGYLPDPRTLSMFIHELDMLRGQMQTMQIYSAMMLPLVYTQVVVIAVYSFFICELFSAQFLQPIVHGNNSTSVSSCIPSCKTDPIDVYVPFFTIVQFLFLMGWLKVAMCVMNPFGKDDEDFQTSDILDYNLEVSYRSALSEENAYPQHLQYVKPIYREQPGSEEDSLYDFLKENEGDLQEIDQGDDMNISALELRQEEYAKKNCGCFSKCKSLRNSLFPPEDKDDTNKSNMKRIPANRITSSIEGSEMLAMRIHLSQNSINMLDYYPINNSRENL